LLGKRAIFARIATGLPPDHRANFPNSERAAS
jgi:hypothetical protein